MIRVAVVSTELRSIGYDEKVRCLEVEFQHLGVYRYFEVPVEEYAALMTAPSKGQYFNAHIRDTYSYEHVS